MILISKSNAPSTHIETEKKHLERLKSISPRTSKDIYGYDGEKKLIWDLQYGKCCYCEQKIPFPYNDIEHYRPKSEAQRQPGCTDTHGYWWLAYYWDNLFYSCASCNRSSKGSLFPLAAGSIILNEGEHPPGKEKAMLIYPGSNDAIQHISFDFIERGKDPNLAVWKAVPINNSEIGIQTIKIIGLNEQDRIEVRMKYFWDTLNPLIRKIKISISENDELSTKIHLTSFRDLFYRNQQFSLFAFSVFIKTFECGCEKLKEYNIDFNREMLGCTIDVDFSQLA